MGGFIFRGFEMDISGIMGFVLMLVTPFVTRAIYKKTRNPYLGGIINAVIITIMTCVNAQIVFPT